MWYVPGSRECTAITAHAADALPVTGSDDKIGENNGTQKTSIDGDNVSAYRQRVERVRDDAGATREALARALEASDVPARVWYPGLASHPQHAIAQRQELLELRQRLARHGG